MKKVLRAIVVAIAVVFLNYSANSQSFNYTPSDGNLGTTYSWIDCSPAAGGTEIQDSEWLQNAGLGDKKDDGYAEVAWPFNFQFYDSYYFAGDKMYLCTNGFIRFDDIPDDDATDTYKNSINSYSPNLGEIVSLAMEDCGFEASNSHAYYSLTGSGSTRVFTVEYNNLEVRFNQNKYVDVQVSFYETSNKIVVKVGSFDVASANSTYLGIHSGNSSYKDQWGELQSIGANKWRSYIPPAKSTPTISITQASTDGVYPSVNNEMLRVQFDITGGGGVFNLTDLDVTAHNDANTDVTNVKLFHTINTTFSTEHQIGSNVTISGGKYTFSGLSYDMPGGTSYVWVTYDISSSAVNGNAVDGYIAANDISIGGSNYPSSIANPAGDRTIEYFEWDGSTSEFWTVGSNWSTNTVPTSSDNVIIPSGTPHDPILRTTHKGKCKDLKIELGATLTVENSNKNLNVYGDIDNGGTLSVTGSYNILLFGTDNVIKGNGTYNSNVKFRLRGTDVQYTLETDLSIYRFDIFSAEDNCTLNINDKSLVCSNRIRNSSANSTINITTGSAETAGDFINDGTFNSGTGTFYYANSNSKTILNETYYNLKVKVNAGTRTLTNVSSNMENLELVGVGTAELDNDIDIAGNITIGSGCTLDLNGNDINLETNWTNNGVADLGGNSTVTFDGKGSSHIYGSTIFYDLTIGKNTGDVYADGTNHIVNVLNLNNGVVFSSSNTSVIIDNGASYTGGTDVDSYVNGPMRKDGNSNFKFPIGSFRKYAPCEVLNLSASTQVVSEYFMEGHSNNSSFNAPLTKVSLNEYWNITPSSGVSADVRIFWEDGNWSGIGNLGDLRLAHYNGSSWDELTGATTSGSITSGSITKIGVSSFSPFTFGTIDNTTNPLPIELLSFDAEAVNNEVLVNWKTASEKDNDYFIVERSKDGIDAERVGVVQGAGNSIEVLKYAFKDVNPYAGVSYYRLTQVDYNGQSETFDWVAVNIENKKEASLDIYPNPLSNGNLNMNLQNISGQTRIIIYDFSGRVVYQRIKNIVNENQHLQLHLDLAKGAYNVQIVNEQQTVVKRLIVK